MWNNRRLCFRSGPAALCLSASVLNYSSSLSDITHALREREGEREGERTLSESKRKGRTVLLVF